MNDTDWSRRGRLPYPKTLSPRHAEVRESLNPTTGLGRGTELAPRLGSCSQAPGAGAAGCESPQLCPFGKPRCSIPAWTPSHAGHGDAPSPAQVPILPVVEGIPDRFASVWSAAFPALLPAWRGQPVHPAWDKGSRCPLCSRLPCVPPHCNLF